MSNGTENNNDYIALIGDRDIQELNFIRAKLEQTLDTKLSNAGLYFHSSSRVKSLESLKRKLATGKYGTEEDEKKVQDIIGIRINLFYTEDINICESILEDTFMLDNWSKTAWEENQFEAQKCNGVFKLPSKYLVNLSDELWEQPFDKTFEIQLRTVLFEGWHEIEHEMRYKYKPDEEQDESSLWAGQEKDARMMNSIIANLELCDWSIVQIFDNLARDQISKKNWENAIISKYRLRIVQDNLKTEIKEYFDENPEIAKSFLAVSKHQLVDILLNKKYQKALSPNRIIYLINKEIIHDEYVSELLDKEQFGRVINKEIKPEIKPLVSDVVFNQTIRIGDDGFKRACELIYEWAYQHISSIFGQMPKKMETINYEVIGYKISIDADEDSFNMDFQNISNEEAGVVWHVMAILECKPQGIFLTCRNICENIYSRERRYNRPKFMRDIYNQVGCIDAGIFMNEDSGPYEVDYENLMEMIYNKDRSLPILLVDKPEQVPEWAQNFDGYIINTDVLSKSLAGICHVIKCDKECKKELQKTYGDKTIDGSVIYWNKGAGVKVGPAQPVIYTMEAINQACFEEVNHSVDEDEEYEKAFRYRLRELVCQEFR